MSAEQEIRKRLLDVYDENNDLPFKGRVHLARKKKPDSWYIKFAEGLLLCTAIGLLYCTYYHFDRVHFHVNRFYATLGYQEAQHVVAHSYLHGIGADQHMENAIYWLQQASEKGHTKAQYNLAIAHLKGIATGLKEGEARQLIEKAAQAGLSEAQKTLETICAQGGCEI
ncbi:unnamed protein product [Didymodactylos carnosus]|uniref:Sel1 repeat family protein n=1 Tax=Didymodactylos carnosus TaxID=1234261 RepID=A0A814DA20_9BILA|nr:unnamed protein product [Didymodactylos carnosus]CAF1156836.1 unnamed protein product [Didymodactylos carnosus]CAF3728061.1 unnamed protein product [Didymodactylos carnosus]CAF3968342.1 unnamed protein product [Didymodactylos carnosus]